MSCVVHRAEALHGRKVIESRYSDGDKSEALAYIVSRLPKDVSLTYVGDDVTERGEKVSVSMVVWTDEQRIRQLARASRGTARASALPRRGAG